MADIVASYPKNLVSSPDLRSVSEPALYGSSRTYQPKGACQGRCNLPLISKTMRQALLVGTLVKYQSREITPGSAINPDQTTNQDDTSLTGILSTKNTQNRLAPQRCRIAPGENLSYVTYPNIREVKSANHHASDTGPVAVGSEEVCASQEMNA